jgi:hypothetical protein
LPKVQLRTPQRRKAVGGESGLRNLAGDIVRRPMITLSHPFVLSALGGGVLGLAAFVSGWFVTKPVSRMLLLGVGIFLFVPSTYLALLANPGLIDARFRVYQQFYRNIEVGMSREQVLEAMERRYPATGERKRPKIMEDSSSLLGFFMNPEGSREPNCEGIFLTMREGRVVERTYSMD